MSDARIAEIRERREHSAEQIYRTEDIDHLLTALSDRDRRIAELEAALKETDDLLLEYPVDPVGTGSMPPKKEMRRIDEILQRVEERRAASAAKGGRNVEGRMNHRTPEMNAHLTTTPPALEERARNAATMAGPYLGGLLKELAAELDRLRAEQAVTS